MAGQLFPGESLIDALEGGDCRILSSDGDVSSLSFNNIISGLQEAGLSPQVQEAGTMRADFNRMVAAVETSAPAVTEPEYKPDLTQRVSMGINV